MLCHRCWYLITADTLPDMKYFEVHLWDSNVRRIAAIKLMPDQIISCVAMISALLLSNSTVLWTVLNHKRCCRKKTTAKKLRTTFINWELIMPIFCRCWSSCPILTAADSCWCRTTISNATVLYWKRWNDSRSTIYLSFCPHYSTAHLNSESGH